ncbi:hypothetical protein BUE80_DR004635 [Diplocarpon rosae]|nr:hypothetical protein BUE80_DR004635 [Diplocarpon rosae]
MMLFFGLGLALASVATAQNSSALIPSTATTRYGSGVPTDAPIPGNYNGQISVFESGTSSPEFWSWLTCCWKVATPNPFLAADELHE